MPKKIHRIAYSLLAAVAVASCGGGEESWEETWEVQASEQECYGTYPTLCLVARNGPTSPWTYEYGLSGFHYEMGHRYQLKVRVTKVPFSGTPKALIESHTKGFVKIVSDPATGVVLGGSVVGRHAGELISVLAVAVTNGLKVSDIVDSLLVHPSLAEALAEAAE